METISFCRSRDQVHLTIPLLLSFPRKRDLPESLGALLRWSGLIIQSKCREEAQGVGSGRCCDMPDAHEHSYQKC